MTANHTSRAAALTDTIMEQAQVYASAWSLIDGPFDHGNALATAEHEKAELRNLVGKTVETLEQHAAARVRPSILDAADVLRDAVQANSMFAIGIVHGITSLASGKPIAPLSLEGLRRAILTPREIERDEDGMLSHPAVPYLDEDVNYETFFAAFGIDAAFIHMENDVDCDTYDKYFASNSANCSFWTPSAPTGDGWLLLEIYDTEDGPVALFVREKKRESMRERLKREDAEQCSLFQSRVRPWMLECFGAEIAADRAERNHRFLEEALELVQACGCTASEAHQLVNYTFGRPAGEPDQEVGGVMVTLAALCLANGLCMHTAGETELARIGAPAMVEKIRAKQAAKPKHSPLPGPSEPRAPYEWRDTGALESGDAS